MTNDVAIQMLAVASDSLADVLMEAEQRVRSGVISSAEFQELVEQIERGRESCYLAVKLIRKLAEK